jgi:outer membrane protein TolC
MITGAADFACRPMFLKSSRQRLAIMLFMVAIASVPPQAASAQSEPQAGNNGAPLTLTLSDALTRARANSAEFQAAVAAAGLAHEDKVQVRSALLPNVGYNNQYLYTEGNGTSTGRFIANNGVHEYISQGNAHQDFNLALGGVAEYRRAAALQALTEAKAEIAARGLVVTVVQNYYGLVVAERKYATAQKAADEAQHFLNISRDLERGGEVAYSDVIKAQLQYNQRQRDLQEAQLSMSKARLALAVLLFPNFNQNFTVVDDLSTVPPLPSREEVQQLASRNNPDLRAALASVQAGNFEVLAARSKFIPSLALDYFYGIDANHFAVSSFGIRNLGYAAFATLNIPVWNWGATLSRLHQAELRRSQAQVELSAAHRQFLADLQSFYDEADTARAEMDNLRASAQLAADSLRLITLRYEAGEASVLEVVDAQNTLTATRNAFDDGEARYRVALANLQRLTGTF